MREKKKTLKNENIIIVLDIRKLQTLQNPRNFVSNKTETQESTKRKSTNTNPYHHKHQNMNKITEY